MAYRITSECINCGVCKVECKDKAIKEGEVVYEVAAEKCTDCGICADICPTAACKPA